MIVAKRLTGIFICIILTLAFTACSGDNTTTKRTDYDNGSYVISEYSKDDVLTKTSWHRKNNTLIEEKEYDKEGNCVLVIDYDEKGIKKRAHEITDGVAGKIIEYQPNGLVSRYAISAYDENRLLISRTWYTADDVKEMMDEFEYIDQNIWLVRTTFYNIDGSVKEVMEFDK